MKAKNTVKKTDEPPIKSPNIFPVVGIGASAGGLDAFKKLLKAIPEDSGMAYVLVQHLDPKHESLLPELLQKVTKLPVLEITDDIKVHPDHIYVIPSNKMMVATDGVLLLKPRPVKSNTERNLPIDLFFTSLAEVHQEHAIGVVLSGTASDGTQGLKAIKDHGGITFAQDEASAEYEGMPHSAVQAGVVDFILPPQEIPKKLLEIINKTILSDEELQNIPKQEEDIFKQILSLLRIRKGVDFTYYKQTTIRRRILRRMVVNKNEETGDYLKFLRGNNLEQDLLYQDMLIPVTSFFRDKKVFDNLCDTVFPAIIKNKIPGEITRVWVAGCSTGQEVFSFAICFKEFLGDNHERIQIFGTDLSEPAITKARSGLYEKSEIDGISPERMKEYFTKSNGGYQVNKSIRDMCVFAHHNFLKDPPFGKMDCISCRNVLIYMEPYLQKKALTTFHYALNPKGFLLLGKSETTGGVPDLFAAVEKADKLYTRKDVPGRFIQVASLRSEQILNRPSDSSKSEPLRTDFQKTADDILLTKYTPAGVVVNETMDIVHFRGNTAKYLEQAPGKPSHNLLMMAKSGLGFELRNILHKAKTDKV
ncbi:MAG: chemotaxis protein CheB, partial [Ferruginibacter sp.]